MPRLGRNRCPIHADTSLEIGVAWTVANGRWVIAFGRWPWTVLEGLRTAKSQPKGARDLVGWVILNILEDLLPRSGPAFKPPAGKWRAGKGKTGAAQVLALHPDKLRAVYAATGWTPKKLRAAVLDRLQFALTEIVWGEHREDLVPLMLGMRRSRGAGSPTGVGGVRGGGAM